MRRRFVERFTVQLAVVGAMLTIGLMALAIGATGGKSEQPTVAAKAHTDSETKTHLSMQPGVLFCIGDQDDSSVEFGAAKGGYTAFTRTFPNPIEYTIGKSTPDDWPFIQPSTHDTWAGGKPHPFTIHFNVTKEQTNIPLYLTLGILADWEPSKVAITANGQPIEERRLPAEASMVSLAFDTQGAGIPTPIVFKIPANSLKSGANTLTITLNDGSWLIYDYVMLSANPEPPKPPTIDLLKEFEAGPMANVNEIVFAVRKPGNDGHWYANFAYDANDPNLKMYNDGGKLCVLNVKTGKVRVLLEDSKGGVRDPQVHYNGNRIIFSYRKGGDAFYHLYEINADGSRLTQITNGPFDDIEPTYSPDGGIIFVSSRAKRWVNCWRTPVAVLYRCEADGSDLRQISANIEHDNTPWPMPDGRILYTRWEYIDRSQVDYHHLWTANPDGTSHMVYFGNLRPGTVMIDAKPISGSNKVVAIFSPGHGIREHEGDIYVVDPTNGPDDVTNTRRISSGTRYRDPWAFTSEAFLAASGPSILLMNGRGKTQPIYKLSENDIHAGFEIQEPRPLMRHPREAMIPPRTNLSDPNGKMILSDVYRGRNMDGVKRGDIKKLLVLESLPKPVNFTGGMEPMSYGGTFTLERVLGTVPVEPDGSAYFELPALRSIFFIALDAQDQPVKRMQSFTSAEPGVTIGCVGCHEKRIVAPTEPVRTTCMAVAHAPSKIVPIADVPDIYDFPRDIQPILDRHCLSCHNWKKPDGGVVLSGDHGPIYSQNYFTLFSHDQVKDGRNLARSNYAPRTLGSVASPLMDKLKVSHYGVTVTDQERATVRLWIDVGAPYPGTYAALETGMVGGYRVNEQDRSDLQWPETKAAMDAIARRCGSCHTGDSALPLSVSDDQGRQPWIYMGPGDPRRKYANHLLYNLTQPENSPLLLAPLAKEAGGWGLCKQGAGNAHVFANTFDPDYALILGGIAAAKQKLDEIKRFDMPGFLPHPGWVREMKRYGILADFYNPKDPVNTYIIEREYWSSLWYKPIPIRNKSRGSSPTDSWSSPGM